MVAIHSIPEEIVKLAMANPMVMIASDGIMDEGQGPSAGGGDVCARAREDMCASRRR